VAGTKPKREWVPLDRLVRDPALQMRASLPDGLTDAATVERYREAMQEGEEFPPLEVVSDGQSYWLFDGFQRAAAVELAGKGSAECLIFSGTYQDALLRAISANARHGLTRTISDCRRALMTLIDTPELLQKVLAQAKDQGGVHLALATTCCISKGLVYKVLEDRNLRAVGGKLVKKRALPAQHIPEDSSSSSVGPRSPGPRSNSAESRPTVSQTDDLPHPEPISDEESSANRELERTRNAVVSIRNGVRKLLDGPFATQLLRCAGNHRIPFTREGSSFPLKAELSAGALSEIAQWEPLGKIEAVFADLAAIVSAGLELD
jgi:hypothetical protein